MNPFYPDALRDVTLNQIEEQNNSLTTPPPENFNTDAMRGSMQQMLSDNLGLYVVCEFLVGTQAMTSKSGILYNVGRSYFTLYEEETQTFIVCDVFSVKFVTFYLPGRRPGQANGEIPLPTVTIPGVGQIPAGPYGLGSGTTSPSANRSVTPRSSSSRR